MDSLELKKIRLEDISPAEYNPRFITDDDFEYLRRSLSTFGMVDPIIINLKNFNIVGGHQRYSVLKDEDVDELYLIELGDVGWAFRDTDLRIEDRTHEASLNVALNNISGSFDEYKLEKLLSEIIVDIPDIEVTGFSEDDIMRMQIENDIVFDNLSNDNIDLDLEDIYEEPPKKLIKCPKCNHIDDISFFKKINNVED